MKYFKKIVGNDLELIRVEKEYGKDEYYGTIILANNNEIRFEKQCDILIEDINNSCEEYGIKIEEITKRQFDILESKLRMLQS
jgi:hypothetical protein